MSSRFSTLWVFATLNYLYCDLVTLMNPDLLKQYLAGNVGGIDISQGFLLGAAFLVEIPMAMVLLSRVLNYRANRLANIIAGMIMTVVQLATLLVQVPTLYYVFFSTIEIGSTAFITWVAWRWRTRISAPRPDFRSSAPEPEARGKGAALVSSLGSPPSAARLGGSVT